MEFPQLRQLITIQSITYTKNEVPENWLPQTYHFSPDFVRYPTGAAACVGTLRAAATLPPSWHCALPRRQVRRQLSAPYGQPPISRRVGLALFPSDRCGGSCRHPTGSRQSAAELALLAGRWLRVSIPLRSISPARCALICFRVALLLRLFCRARYMFF